jgi:putative transposase
MMKCSHIVTVCAQHTQRCDLGRINGKRRKRHHLRLTTVRQGERGTFYLLHRIGFTAQGPAHRAAERDEAAIAAWRDVTWGKLRG